MSRILICAGAVACLALALGPLAHATEGITPTPQATWKTGPIGDRAWMIPSGRLITPVGDRVRVDSMPVASVLSHDGRYLVVACAGEERSLTVVDTEAFEVVQEVEMDAVFNGLRFEADGATLYAASAQKIRVYDFANGRLTERDAWPVQGHVGGLALGTEEKILYAVAQTPGSLFSKDMLTGAELDRVVIYGDPYAVAVSPRFAQVYVSQERGDRVDIFNVARARNIRKVGSVSVGKNPEEMIVSADGNWLYVANSDDDSFSIVDLVARRLKATIDLRPLGIGIEFGSTPNALAISPDGERLFVAQASDNAVAVVELPEGQLLGRIPTGWYPTALTLTEDGETLFVSSGKGTGTVPQGVLRNDGMVQRLPVPGDGALSRMTRRVNTNNSLPARLFDVDEAAFEGPVPLVRGGPTPIEHVIFVVRENKTYDAVLGDWEGGDGDPANCVFCGDVTPNLHALVEEFASGDNYYSNAEASIQGHEWTTAGMANSYVEKHMELPRLGRPFELDVFINPSTFPRKNYIFGNCLENGVSFRDYGEAVGVGKDLLVFDPRYVHWSRYDPPVFWMQSRDVDKLDDRIKEWERGVFPQLLYMLFPNDHHQGCQWPFPSPESMVADNDWATGRLIEWLSESEHWESTIVFVIEDDPQQGTDHVDPHRSILLVAGGYAKRGYVSPVHYCEANLHATIQHILGLPPQTIYDEIAQPMWDMFSTEPDLTPFESIPRIIPEGPCQLGTTFARRSEGLEWLLPDEADGLAQLSEDYSRDLARRGHPELSARETRWAQAWQSIGEWLIEEGPDEGRPVQAEPER